MNCKIFYSWQSDLPNRTNRGFIQDALEKAIKNLRKDDSIKLEPVIDRDTQGVSGAPDIAETIFEKIEQCQIFVCDVSIINQDTPFINQDKEPRPTPNPNVLVELGYAMKTLGWQKIIIVMNTAFGKVEQLPFDLRMRRTICYSMPEENEERAEERKKLVQSLTGAIGTLLKTLEEETLQEAVVSIGERAREAVENFQPNQKRLVRKFMQWLTDEMHKLKPDFSTGVSPKESLLEAIGKTEELVVEFASLSEVIADTKDSSEAANTLYGAFENLLNNYELSPDFFGTFRKFDFDFYRFMGYELFTIFFSFLIRENRWELIDELLKKEFDIKNPFSNDKREASFMPFTYVSYDAPVLLISPHQEYADILNKRHTGGEKLAETVSMEQFMDADCFLLLRALSQKESNFNFQWFAWSLFYMKRPPRYLSEAKSAEFAKQLFRPLNVKTIYELRSLVERAKQKLTGIWGKPLHELTPQRLQDFNPQEIGSQE